MSDPTLETELRTTAEVARTVTRQALEYTAAQLAAGTHKDPAGAARNAAVVMGISLDKLHSIQDRPPPPPSHTRDPRVEIKLMARYFGIVESTDEERAEAKRQLDAARGD
jgi:hypothetical protein